MMKTETKVSLLERAIKYVAEEHVGVSNRREALEWISEVVNRYGAYEVAKMYGLLVDNSAEEFMLEFMPVFNEEIGSNEFVPQGY